MTERRRKQSTQTPKENEVKSTISRKELISQIIKRKTKEKFLSESQRKYYDILTKNQITIVLFKGLHQGFGFCLINRVMPFRRAAIN